MDFEWAASLGRNSVPIVEAGVSFDAWMMGVLFKGRTFSGHFFEMIICHLAAGGAAVLSANGVNQSQTWAPHVDSPDRSCQFLDTVRLARKSERRVRGWRAAGCSRKGNSCCGACGCLHLFAQSFEFGRTTPGFRGHFLPLCCVPMVDAGVCNYNSHKTWIRSTCLRLNPVQSSTADNKGDTHWLIVPVMTLLPGSL